LRSDGEFKLLFEPPERSKPAGTTPTTEVGSRLWLKVAEGVPVTTLSHRCGLGPLGVAKSRDRKNPCRFTDDLQSGDRLLTRSGNVEVALSETSSVGA